MCGSASLCNKGLLKQIYVVISCGRLMPNLTDPGLGRREAYICTFAIITCGDRNLMNNATPNHEEPAGIRLPLHLDGVPPVSELRKSVEKFTA